jgi:hypothetical protein
VDEEESLTMLNGFAEIFHAGEETHGEDKQTPT